MKSKAPRLNASCQRVLTQFQGLAEADQAKLLTTLLTDTSFSRAREAVNVPTLADIQTDVAIVDSVAELATRLSDNDYKSKAGRRIKNAIVSAVAGDSVISRRLTKRVCARLRILNRAYFLERHKGRKGYIPGVFSTLPLLSGMVPARATCSCVLLVYLHAKIPFLHSHMPCPRHAGVRKKRKDGITSTQRTHCRDFWCSISHASPCYKDVLKINVNRSRKNPRHGCNYMASFVLH